MMTEARIPGACKECNQAIEIIFDRPGYETIIRAEENRRREAEKSLTSERTKSRELEKENRQLKSVVIACSKEPMPEWSKKIWDLHEQLKIEKEKSRRLEERVKALGKIIHKTKLYLGDCALSDQNSTERELWELICQETLALLQRGGE